MYLLRQVRVLVFKYALVLVRLCVTVNRLYTTTVASIYDGGGIGPGAALSDRARRCPDSRRLILLS